MNGFFRLVNVENGFALQLIPPDADGEEINIVEVMDYLQSNNLVYDLSVLREKIDSHIVSEYWLGNESCPAIAEDYKLVVDEDQMTAVVRFIAPSEGGRMLTLEEFVKDLRIRKIIFGIQVQNLQDFFANREEYISLADKIVYTGTIDSYFDYSLGELEYRSLRFETEILDLKEFQPVAVVNYNERQIPYTRIIEHKHFEFGNQPKTVITREYPADWEKGDEPYYPVNDDRNNSLYEQYKRLAENEKNVIFGGRLGQYKYYDMDKCIESALALCKEELGNE